MPRLPLLARHLDTYLRIREIADWPAAWNGLQVENSGTVTKVGAAVDACESVIGEAVERGIDLLLVHHGLFWSGVQPVVGATYRKMRAALAGNLAIYSAHLPLDVHPSARQQRAARQGSRTQALRAVLPRKRPADRSCAPRSTLPARRSGAAARERGRRSGSCLPRWPARVAKVGIVTGGAGAEVAKAAAEGVDTFITGEGPHWSYTLAEELGVNLLYAGHYATETFGVKALAAHVAKKFRVPWEFIDHPTGL